MKKSNCDIAVVTATRAEYGLLLPVIRRLHHAGVLRLLVMGAHLCPRLGQTVQEIEQDGVPIAARLPIFPE